jgi:ketosteroid isomerase-like protein
MKSKGIVVVSLFVAMMFASGVNSAQRQAESESATAHELTAMLQKFMDDAGHNNAAGFDTFFADDVIYTRSTGAVITKADIMKSVRGSSPVLETTTTYTAEDVSVHEYGDTAIVAFRLVRHDEHSAGKPPSISNYRNTGVFLRRNGKLQVVAWQSTIVAPSPTTN